MSFQQEFERINADYLNGISSQGQNSSFVSMAFTSFQNKIMDVNMYILLVPIVIGVLLHFMIKPSFIHSTMTLTTTDDNQKSTSDPQTSMPRLFISTIAISAILIGALYYYNPNFLIR